MNRRNACALLIIIIITTILTLLSTLQVKAEVAKLSDDDATNGAVYVKVLEKAVEKGDDYLTKEAARLDKMLSSGSVATAKVEELSRKLSVLSAINGDE